MLRLYPNAKLATGPAIDNGFFYDFDVDAPFTAEDLEKIEAEMKKIVKEDLPVERFYLPADEAKKLMEERGQNYKVELIDEHSSKGEDLSFYKQGEFIDLCADRIFKHRQDKSYKAYSVHRRILACRRLE